MNPKFIDYVNDLRSDWSKLSHYVRAYCRECSFIAVSNANRLESNLDKMKKISPARMEFIEPLEIEQSFEDFLLECFNREVGEKIQGEDNE